jgi:hypothetical protein
MHLRVTFEEGTWAAWLYDLLKPHVTLDVEPASERGLYKLTVTYLSKS